MIAAALLQALAYNSAAYSTDDCAYLDQAVLFAQLDFKQAVSTYWSPLFPFIIGLMLKLFNPPLAQQLMAVKLLNVAIFLVMLASFNFFLSKFLSYIEARQSVTDEGHSSSNHQVRFTRRQWIILAYALFAWTSLYVGGVNQTTPDYLVSASLFAATGLALDLQQRTDNLRYALLGIVLSLGYLAKASMIPAMVTLILLSVMRIPRHADKVRSALIAFSCAAIVAAPYWVILSVKTGSFSIGSSAGLNYMLWVNPGYSLLGNNKPEIEKQLIHPMTSLSEKPDIVVFEDVLPATFPPWFDPGYFAQGLKIVFSPVGSALAMILNAVYLFCLFGWQLLVVTIVGRVIAERKSIRMTGWRDSLLIWLPAIMTTVAICTVISLPSGSSTPRYFASTVVLVYLSYFWLRKFPDSERGRKASFLTFLTASLIAGAIFSYGFASDVIRLSRGRVDRPLKVASALHEMGLAPGDKVVLVGKECAEWARIAQLRIVAIVVSEVSDQTTDDVSYLSSMIDKLKSGTGAKAAVYFPDPISDNLVEEEALMKSYRDLFTTLTSIKLAAPPARSRFAREALREWKVVDGGSCFVYFLR